MGFGVIEALHAGLDALTDAASVVYWGGGLLVRLGLLDSPTGDLRG